MTASAPLTPANEQWSTTCLAGQHGPCPACPCWCHRSTPTPANEPADGTDSAALTDEELAEMEAEYRMYRAYASSRDVPRLIAALRAERERVQELEAELAEARFYLNG